MKTLKEFKEAQFIKDKIAAEKIDKKNETARAIDNAIKKTPSIRTLTGR